MQPTNVDFPVKRVKISTLVGEVHHLIVSIFGLSLARLTFYPILELYQYMPNNGFAAASFVANFFKVTKLAIASFDVIVGSYFSPLVERLFEIDQKLVHVWLAENFQRFCERGYLAILCRASHTTPNLPSLARASS